MVERQIKNKHNWIKCEGCGKIKRERGVGYSWGHNGHITSADFYKKFLAWCKENRHREMSDTSVGMMMKKLGIIQERKYFDWLYDGKGGTARVWGGIIWK